MVKKHIMQDTSQEVDDKVFNLPDNTVEEITEINESLNQKLDIIDEDITVTVGENGEYSTINEAIEYLSSYYPIFKSEGITATITLLSGFVMAEQVIVENIDLSWITLQGEDELTNVDCENFTKYIPTQTIDPGLPCVFGAYNSAVLFRIKQLFRCINSANHGISVVNSQAFIDHGCGIEDCSHNGLNAEFSMVAAGGAVFNGCNSGIRIKGGMINADSLVAEYCNTRAVSVSSCGMVVVTNGALTFAGYAGIFSDDGSCVHCAGADVSHAGSIGVDANDGSNVSAQSVVTQGSTYGILCGDGSTVNASHVDSSGNSEGFRVKEGGIINAAGSDGSLSQSPNELTANGIIFQ